MTNIPRPMQLWEKRLALVLLVVVSGILMIAHARSVPIEIKPCTSAAFAHDYAATIAIGSGGVMIKIDDAVEAKNYMAVLNQVPPASGPVDQLLLVLNPKGVAHVFLLHEGKFCENYLVPAQLHLKAWLAMMGQGT